MKNWLYYRILKYHADKHGASLDLQGDVPYAQLTFGLQKNAVWQVGQGVELGKDGVLSLGEHAKFSLAEQTKIGQRWSVKILGAKTEAIINIGKRCRMEDDVKLITFGEGNLDIADDCFIGWGCVCSAQEKISIGKGTAIAEYVSIRDHNHMPDRGAIHLSPMKIRPVQIGEHVWIGAKATIIAGVTIGNNAVIGANAVVTKDVPAGAKVAGVPARPIG